MRTPPNERLAPDIAGFAGSRASAGDEARAAPERKCVLTGSGAGRDALLRLALSPEGPDGTSEVLPDALARAPGRGAWIGVTRGELDEAVASGRLKSALARAFKGAKLRIPADLGERAEAALTRALLDRLGLELRAGHLILGTERIAGEARAGAVSWLGHAADASEDGSKKLDQAWRVGCDAEGTGLAGTRLPLDRAALSMALGRDNVVHLALADRVSAERVAIPLQRLMRFTGAVPAAERASGDRTAHAAVRETMTTNRT
jgi:predicted RNA-binding protein YlxR (DUF448 family)